MTQKPKISYLVATYDTAGYLNRHIGDLLEKQNYSNFEIVVINHESPGADLQIAQAWAERDKRVVVIDEKDYGCYGPAWVQGWQAAKGEFVCNSNVDDSHHPDFTRKFHDHMIGAVFEVGFCYAGIQVVDEATGRVTSAGIKPPFDFNVMSRECWAGPQVCWRNDESFRNRMSWKLMMTRAKEHQSAFDYWLWLYFMSQGFYGSVIPEILTYYLKRANSVENRNKAQNNYETYAAISEFFPHNFKTYLKHAKEFADFSQLPNKEEWIRRNGR